jgi:hypothetical protein
MAGDDLHDEIDSFALEVEQTIAQGQQYLEEVPEFEGYGKKARKLQQFFGTHPQNR